MPSPARENKRGGQRLVDEPCRLVDYPARLADDRELDVHEVCSVDDAATIDVYTLSLHDALPISFKFEAASDRGRWLVVGGCGWVRDSPPTIHHPPSTIHHPLTTKDRKSTRLNSSHSQISYAVSCPRKQTWGAATRRRAVPTRRLPGPPGRRPRAGCARSLFR